MGISWADVTAIAPELDDVPLAGQSVILSHANTALDEGAFDHEQLRAARAYLAAHMGTLTHRGGDGPGGPIESEDIPGMTLSYSVPSPAGTDPLLDRTPYGQMYRYLVRFHKKRGPVTLC